MNTTMNTVRRRREALRAAALAAAARSWPVFPLRPRTKIPALPGWQQRATLDPHLIDHWWDRLPYNIGIACGPAGLVVLDLDTDRGESPPPPWNLPGIHDGTDVLAHLAHDHHQPDPHDTYTVTTPTGGQHRYFHAPPGPALRNTTGASARGLGWRIDARANGGFVVAAGSHRPTRGRLYPYLISRDLPLAVLPAWLTRLLTPAAVPATGSANGSAAGPAAVVLPPAGPRLAAYVRAVLASEADRVTAALPGGRASTVFAAAARLGELVGAGALDITVAEASLLHAARAHNGVQGWTDHEARHHITNGLHRGRGNPRRLPA